MELAKKSGVPQPTISQIEKGNRKFPTYENIRKIAKALGIGLEELDEDNETQCKEECNPRSEWHV